MNTNEIIKKIDYALEILDNIKKRKLQNELEKSRNKTDKKLQDLYDLFENKLVSK